MLIWQVFYTYQSRAPLKDIMTQNFLMKVGREKNPPESAPMEIQELVRSCWEANPSNRPAASELVAKLKEVPLSEESASMLRRDSKVDYATRLCIGEK